MGRSFSRSGFCRIKSAGSASARRRRRLHLWNHLDGDSSGHTVRHAVQEDEEITGQPHLRSHHQRRVHAGSRAVQFGKKEWDYHPQIPGLCDRGLCYRKSSSSSAQGQGLQRARKGIEAETCLRWILKGKNSIPAASVLPSATIAQAHLMLLIRLRLRLNSSCG